jgi:hypothetical protein
MTEYLKSAVSRRRSPRVQSWTLAVIYVFAVALLFGCAYWFRFDLNNVDGISYISIARQYAEGFTATAVNAYWSPMISWLLAPLLALGFSGTAGFMLLNAVFGALGIGMGSLFLWKKTGGNFISTLLFLIISTIFFAGTSFILTPDSFVAVWVILFFISLSWLDELVDTPGVSNRRIWVGGAVLGMVGVLGYFIKLFIVPVFSVTVIFWLIIRMWRSDGATLWARSRPAVLALVSAAIVVAVIGAPWAIALSAKYDKPTIGTSFAVNMEKKFAPTTAEVQAPSVTLEAPPSTHAVSFGEDRSFQVADAPTAGDQGLLSRATYYLQQRVLAFPYYVSKIGSIAPFAVVTFVGFVLALVFGFASFRKHRRVAIAGLIGAVYFLGYAAITSASTGGGNSRYYWPLFLISIMMDALLLPALWSSLVVRRPGRLRAIAFVALIGLLPIAAAVQHGVGSSAPFATGHGGDGFRELIAEHNKPSAEQTFAGKELSSVIPPDSRIVGTNYRSSLRLAYFLDAHVYGRSGALYIANDPRLLQALRDNKIDYYLDFAPVAAQKQLLAPLGTIVARFLKVQSCNDSKVPTPQQCLIRVVKVNQGTAG